MAAFAIRSETGRRVLGIGRRLIVGEMTINALLGSPLEDIVLVASSACQCPVLPHEWIGIMVEARVLPRSGDVAALALGGPTLALMIGICCPDQLLGMAHFAGGIQTSKTPHMSTRMTSLTSSDRMNTGERETSPGMLGDLPPGNPGCFVMAALTVLAEP